MNTNTDPDSLIALLTDRIIAHLTTLDHSSLPNTDYHALLPNSTITFFYLCYLKHQLQQNLQSNEQFRDLEKPVIEYKFSAIFPSLGLLSTTFANAPTIIHNTYPQKNQLPNLLLPSQFHIHIESSTLIPDNHFHSHFSGFLNTFEYLAKFIRRPPSLDLEVSPTYEAFELFKYKLFQYTPLSVITAQHSNPTISEQHCASWFRTNYLAWATHFLNLILPLTSHRCIMDDQKTTVRIIDNKSPTFTSLNTTQEGIYATNYPLTPKFTIDLTDHSPIVQTLAIADITTLPLLDSNNDHNIFSHTLHPYFHQLATYMLLNDVNSAFLSNGIQLAYFELDITKNIDKYAIPIRFKLLDNSSSPLNMRSLILAVLYKQLTKHWSQRTQELQAFYNFRRATLNPIAKVLPQIHSTVREYLTSKKLHLDTYKFIELDDSTKIKKLQSGYKYLSQVITIPTNLFLIHFPHHKIYHTSLKPSDQHVVLKIHDISGPIVTIDPNRENYHQILSTSNHKFKTESAVYKKIYHLNRHHNANIPTPRIFGFFENFHILIKGKYYFAGHVIAMEYLTVKPKTDHDFDNGAQLLKLLHQNGIVHNDVNFDNMFINHENQFVYIDFASATLPENSETE